MVGDMERTKDFYLTLFSELNEHLRATDAKSLTIAGFYVALCGAGMAASFQQYGAVIGQPEIRIFGIICVFVLTVGSFVNILQYWYRLWKAHYIQTCKKIAKSILGASEDRDLLPVWLRSVGSKDNISIDGLMYFLTGLLNLVFLLCVCWIASLELPALPVFYFGRASWALPMLILAVYYSVDTLIKLEAKRLRRAD